MNVQCSAEPCPVILDSTCVFYRGADLVYTGILTNDNLEIVIQKINNKFKDAAIGYEFNNGIVQAISGGPVQLGGPLVQNTTINSNGYPLTITGTVNAGSFVTIGGTSSQFVKGDGSLDGTSYQPAGNYITALSGDGTAAGPGSATFTLNNVNAFPGTYGSSIKVPVVTVNSKGLVTSVVENNIAFPNGQLIFVGDVIGSGYTGSNTVLTLATVNTNIYGSNTFLKFAVNGKGLVTSATPVTGLDIEGTLGYTPVPTTRTITINGVTQNLAANRTWTISELPPQVGNAGKYLTTDGTTASWATLPPSGVSAVTASAPLASSGGATPNITITQASGSTNGYLSSTDWNTFNNKQNALTLTTTGTSGPATLVGSTLNIPQYSGGSGTVTSIATSAPITGGTITTTGTIGITQATTLTDGYLSSTDWNTFNSKEPAIAAGTTSQYWRGDKTWQTFPTIPTVTPSALTSVDDTNVTLTLGGSPNTA